MSQSNIPPNQHEILPKEYSRELPTSHRPAPSQEELHERYLEQLRRLSCPGCGESGEFI